MKTQKNLDLLIYENQDDLEGYASDKDDETTGNLAKKLDAVKINDLRLYRFSDPMKAKIAEKKFQDYVNARFFRLDDLQKPVMNNAKSHNLLEQLRALSKLNDASANKQLIDTKTEKQIKAALYKKVATKYNPLAIQLDGHSARSAIISLSRILNENQFIPTAVFKIGETYILCISNPTADQKGNVNLQTIDHTGAIKFVPSVYGDGNGQLSNSIPNRLETIIKSNPNINVFDLMRKASKSIASFSLENTIKLPASQDVFLDQLNFLRAIIEISRRGYKGNNVSNNSKKLDSLPIGITQARTSQLLIDKKITHEDAYGMDNDKKYYKENLIQTFNGNEPENKVHKSPFGAVTGKELVANAKEVENKIERINIEYNKRYQHYASQDKPYVIEGRNLLRKRLGEEFGSAGESSGEEYSNSETDGAEIVKFTP